MKATVEAPVLELATKAFIDKLDAQHAKPIYKLSPEEARKVLETLQSGPVEKFKVKTEDKAIQDKELGNFNIKIFRPSDAKGVLPVILYIHGAGWVMGSPKTHEHLVSKLCSDTNCAVAFVDYTLSPDAQFPVAIEQCYKAAKYIEDNAKALNLDVSHYCIAGDSVGGNMTIALTLLAKERKGPRFEKQIVFYPVTSSDMNTASYQQFADGPWLTKAAMQYFWNAYQEDVAERRNILMSPLNATVEQLKGLPPALVITDENDVLRDEVEAYAHKLMQAGVKTIAVRMIGTIHDFLMLNALSQTPAALAAMALAAQFIKEGK